MMKISTLLVLIVVYLAGATLTFGAFNAAMQQRCHHRWQDTCDAQMVRDDRRLVALYAVIPIFWISVIFITDFYSAGISFDATPDHRFLAREAVAFRRQRDSVSGGSRRT
jgi:hypothetical protein